MPRADIPYGAFLSLARRYGRDGEDAEDIVQEVLIAAVAAGREDFSNSQNRRWIAGAIRRRAAFDARSAVRRRQRESRWQAERSGVDAPFEGVLLETVLAELPKALRVVAALALSGHTRAEIAYLLGLTDAALRQRIRELKKALARRGVPMPPEMSGLNLDLAYGAIRQALAPALKRHGGAFATHDPDGHLFVIRKISRKS
ncbi:RNA polymerase sigma factor [Pelagibacterium limicola]|uniref:RNA polymerase sigma factor n=1 Tax=Pelagibacterium limicola TaxID=2791022 RepID=UPI0018AFBB6C|nr:sigma-70 family RNA polymerase sigma factor [Pelagibacterium limicola]